MVYKGSNETYDFRKFKTIHNEIRNNIINISKANDKLGQLFKRINEFKNKTRIKNSVSKKVEEDVLEMVRREMVSKAFESEIFLKPE